ncbi:MAG: iron-sulfur cluster repair di-iron protein [Bacteroidota bacterium]
MTDNAIHTLSIKDIVVQNFHAAAVFEKYSLDFCCRGGKTVHKACEEKKIDPQVVFAELSVLESEQDASGMRYTEWEPDFLVNYIIQNHHAYVRKMIPVLYAHTQKIAAVHGSNHPELNKIALHFENVAVEMQQHMIKEEQMLFPFITALHKAQTTNQPAPVPHFGSVQNPIRMMEQEHEHAGDEMYAIRELSNNYSVPEDGCTTYRVTFQELRDFEMDLHRHVHLENNVLFPKAVKMENDIITAH